MRKLKKHILLLCLIGFCSSIGLFAQKADFKKADILYRQKSYAEAIPIYEKGLQSKDSRSARSKLAYCYKMLNQVGKAAKLYEILAQDERIRPDDLYYYGEVLMSQGKYAEAKSWFLKYYELEPDEEKAFRMAKACDEVPFIEALFPQASVAEFPHNSPYDENSPVFYNNGIVFSSDKKTGVKLLKQKSGTTGRDFIRIYFSTLNEQKEWASPRPFSKRINELNKNNANACFSPDGSTIYFTRNGNVSNRKNAFTLQLYTARKEKGKWKKIEVLPFCRPNHNYMHPAISPDGNTLFFVSDKPRGKGGTDIYYAQKKGDKWGRAINLDSMINTRAHEGFPFMSTDGKLFFCSKGHLGFGGYDIFMSQKTEDGSWTKPINVGKPINSPLDDISITFNKEMTAGAFTSARNGGNDDIFLFSLVDDISVEAKPMEVTQNAEPTPTENMNTSPSLENKKSKSNEAITTNETEVNIPEKEVENAAHLESTNNVAMPQNETPLTVTDLEKNPSIEMEHIPTNDNVPSENHTITEKTEEEPTELPEPKEVELAPSNDNTPVEASVSASMEQKTKEDFSPSIPDNNEDNILATADTLTDVSINEPAKTNVKITTESTESPTETSSHEKVISEDMLKVKQNSDVSNTPNTETGSLQEIHPSEDMASSVQGLTANATRQELSFKELKKAVSKGDYTSGMYFTIKDLNFAPNEYLLAPKMTLKLKPILKLLEQNDDIKLDITVHTQSIGYDENNLLISQKRAKAIKNYLLYKGIPADRITVRGLGETDLANHCANGVVCTEDEHMENERVAVRIQ